MSFSERRTAARATTSSYPQDAAGGQPIGKGVIGQTTGPQGYLTITFGIALRGDFPTRG